jgi:hypothetical protein
MNSILEQRGKGQPTGTSPNRLLPGDVVEVLTWPEIRDTLDENGLRDALPFMPEMLKYCGQRFVVSKRLERTCEGTDGSMRRIRDVVFLEDLRCDGSAHDGCQLRCALFWKESWLRKVDKDTPRQANAPSAGCADDPFPYKHKLADGQYICQSTELTRATTALSRLDVGCYVRDVRART